MTTFNDSESGASVRTKINAAITTVDSLGSGDNLLLTAAERAAIAANSAKTTNATHTGDVTGATALTLADGVVTTAKMAASAKTGDGTKVLTGTAGTAGQAAIYDANGNVAGQNVLAVSDLTEKTTPVGADELFVADSEAGGAHKRVSLTNTMTNMAATTTAAGTVELATTAETNTGTDAARVVTPDGLAGSVYGQEVITVCVFNDSEDVATGDGAGDQLIRIPSKLNGWNLVEVAAYVQTAGTTGTTDVQIHNVTDAVDMLSTKLTIDSAETDTSTAAAAAVINGSNDDVATGDKIRLDVDAVSTTAPKGLWVEMTFRAP